MGNTVYVHAMQCWIQYIIRSYVRRTEKINIFNIVSSFVSFRAEGASDRKKDWNWSFNLLRVAVMWECVTFIWSNPRHGQEKKINKKGRKRVRWVKMDIKTLVERCDSVSMKNKTKTIKMATSKNHKLGLLTWYYGSVYVLRQSDTEIHHQSHS